MEIRMTIIIMIMVELVNKGKNDRNNIKEEIEKGNRFVQVICNKENVLYSKFKVLVCIARMIINIGKCIKKFKLHQQSASIRQLFRTLYDG